MEQSVKFLLDYNKLKSVNVLRNVQAVVWSGYGLFYLVINIINQKEIADRDKFIHLYMATFTVAVFYYTYVLVKYHEYNDKINMYLVKDEWETSITNPPQTISRNEFIKRVHEKLLLSEENVSKAIDDLINEGFFTFTSDLTRK